MKRADKHLVSVRQKSYLTWGEVSLTLLSRVRIHLPILAAATLQFNILVFQKNFWSWYSKNAIRAQELKLSEECYWALRAYLLFAKLYSFFSSSFCPPCLLYALVSHSLPLSVTVMTFPVSFFLSSTFPLY